MGYKDIYDDDRGSCRYSIDSIIDNTFINKSKWNIRQTKGLNMEHNIFSDDMFKDCTSAIGYARTAADMNKFNTSISKPAGLVFSVK